MEAEHSALVRSQARSLPPMLSPTRGSVAAGAVQHALSGGPLSQYDVEDAAILSPARLRIDVSFERDRQRCLPPRIRAVVLVPFEVDLRGQRLIVWMAHDEVNMPGPGQRPEQRVPAWYDAVKLIASLSSVLVRPRRLNAPGSDGLSRPSRFEYKPLALVCQMSRVAFATRR